MKKLFAILLAAAMLLGATALAEDLGIQMIGGPNMEAQTLSLDDMKLGETHVIEGYARIEPKVWKFEDYFFQYAKGKPGDHTTDGGNAAENVWSRYHAGDRYYPNIFCKRSGANADFAWLEMDITNLRKEDVDFTQEVTVKVVFDEEYEFAGWVRMYNYDYDVYNANKTLIRSVLDPEDAELTSMMYTCHIVFGCTLPNAVVQGKEPLRMEIKLGDNDLTYHIRK